MFFLSDTAICILVFTGKLHEKDGDVNLLCKTTVAVKARDDKCLHKKLVSIVARYRNVVSKASWLPMMTLTLCELSLKISNVDVLL